MISRYRRNEQSWVPNVYRQHRRARFPCYRTRGRASNRAARTTATRRTPRVPTSRRPSWAIRTQRTTLALRAPIAQLVELRTFNPQVVGSSPTGGTPPQAPGIAPGACGVSGVAPFSPGYCASLQQPRNPHSERLSPIPSASPADPEHPSKEAEPMTPSTNCPPMFRLPGSRKARCRRGHRAPAPIRGRAGRTRNRRGRPRTSATRARSKVMAQLLPTLTDRVDYSAEQAGGTATTPQAQALSSGGVIGAPHLGGIPRGRQRQARAARSGRRRSRRRPAPACPALRWTRCGATLVGGELGTALRDKSCETEFAPR